MDRYTKINGADSAPAAPPAPDHPYPTSGTPGSIPATTMGPWWAHMVTEEIRNVIVAAGLTPDFANLTQLASAIQALGSSKPGLIMFWPTPVCPSWALVRDGSAISRTTYAGLFAVMCPTRTMTTANGSKNLTGLSDTRDLYVGMPIEGPGIAAGATIESITGLTTATMSIVASASATVAVRLFYYGYGTSGSASTFGLPDDRGLFVRGLDTTRGYDISTLTGTTAVSSNAVTGLGSTRGIYVGMPVAAQAGIPGGTTVASITSATAITLSANATVAGARLISFTGGQIGSESADSFQGHVHNTTLSFQMGSYTGNTAHQVGGSTEGYAGAATVFNNGYLTDPFVPANGAARVGPETRPRNRAYLPIITY